MESAADPTGLLPALAHGIREAMRVPGVSVELWGANPVVVKAGDLSDRAVVLPLRFQERDLGQIQIEPRVGQRSMNEAEAGLLRDLVTQAGVAAHAVLVNEELRDSRRRLVTSREEERQRLRRDLHDSLGPGLAAVALGLESTGDIVVADPQQAQDNLRRLRGQLQEAIAEIRRIVHDLRPATLDELGLLSAVTRQARLLSSAEGPEFCVEGQNLSGLDAAVELALYRIACEAMSNVVSHAQARTCVVDIVSSDGRVRLAVSDDGIGMRASPAITQGRGVGLRSMYERAEELGGRCQVEVGPHGGTRIIVELPIGPTT